MEPHEHPEADPGGAAPGGATEEALRRIEARLNRASEAAERLLAEATARLSQPQNAAGTTAPSDQHNASADEAASDQTPPGGWQIPGDADAASERPGRDLELLVNLAQSLRDLIPAELQRRVAEATRELLLALRALIDWYLERSEHRRANPAEVQDIPIL